MKSTLLVALGGIILSLSALGQSSTFTYQGQLNDNGQPANGRYDLRFTLHNALSGGSQVGVSLTNSSVGVTNGLFTTTLDFGSSVFDGNSRWLEIGVRTNGSPSAFTTLTPRQLLSATPYAIHAATYSGTVAATNLTGRIPDANLSTNVALLTNNVTFSGSVTAASFIGNGNALTNLNPTNLVGTIPDARLSTNVALLSATNAVFKGSVTATNFYGEGRGLTNVPGRIFDFVPTGSALTTSANYGYLATNDTTPVVITLPPTAQIPVGNIIRVSGSGAAGWIIAQNAGQRILIGNLLDNVGVTWTTNGSSLINWKAIASSADGSKLIAAANPGTLYTSTNYGATWTPRAANLGNLAWNSVASSADGTRLAACAENNHIYTSTDSGANWTARTAASGGLARTWKSIASSLDGNRLVAAAGSYGIATSINGGANWNLSSSAFSWTGVASSGDGSNLVAVASGQQIHVSTNAGATWTGRFAQHSWTCVASSLDGSVLVAGANTAPNNLLYVSSDYGQSWSASSVSGDWAAVASSADGQRMIAVAKGGGVYVSQNSGISWSLRGNLPTIPNYTGAASSSDGSTMAATAYGNGIFVASKVSTTVGTSGYLIGSRLASVELQHVGNGIFIPISHVGNIRAK